MRIASVAFLLLLAAPALAQDPPVPDTTAPWLYYPLAVGNVWEYRARDLTNGAYYDRRVIPGDTLISGVRYLVREEYRSNSDDTAWELQRVSLLRFDTLSTQVVRWTGTQEVFESCPFGADFNVVVDCRRYPGDTLRVYGGYIENVNIGGELAPAQAYKFFYPDGPVDTEYSVYVAPVGYHYQSFAFCTVCQYDLIYTRLVLEDSTVVEYGSPAPVANEPSAPPASLALTAYPNPSDGPLTLALTAPVPQAVTLAVFDALGRRVHAEEHAVAGQARIVLDGRAWAPGVYVVRVTGADGARATARLVRQ
jgi:hypothetical protein